MATTDLDNPEVAHETSDVNVRAILQFIAALLVVAVVIHVGIWLLFRAFERRTAAVDPAPAPLARPAGQPPPNPRLQRRPVDALNELRAEEETLLNAEGPDRMPIERAKRLIVEKGLLPVR